MTRLSDIQHLLLATAATRPDGSLLPPCDELGDLSDDIRNAMRSLLRRGLAQETEGAAENRVWRMDGERRLGLAITQAGRPAVGDERDDPENNAETADDEVPPGSKIAQVLTLLKASDGCTLDDIMSATGWLPHSSRAALTGLRKKGHVLSSEKIGDVRRYRVVGDAA